jgi:hypothetical protein
MKSFAFFNTTSQYSSIGYIYLINTLIQSSIVLDVYFFKFNFYSSPKIPITSYPIILLEISL